MHHAAFNNTAKCTSLHPAKQALKVFSRTLPSTLPHIPPIALNNTLPVCIAIHSHVDLQVHSQAISEHTLRDTSKCIELHTPTLVCSEVSSQSTSLADQQVCPKLYSMVHLKSNWQPTILCALKFTPKQWWQRFHVTRLQSGLKPNWRPWSLS